MSPEEIVHLCLGQPGAWLDSSWEDHLVAKIGPESKGKIFAFLGEGRVGLKLGGSREEADEWLHRYPEAASVMPYLGRHGWTDLQTAGAIEADDLREAVQESYDRVLTTLPKKHRPLPEPQSTDRAATARRQAGAESTGRS